VPTVNRWTTSATSPRAAAEPAPVAVPRGLTLLEIIVVISILLAAGAIAVPFTFAELERRRLVLIEDRLSMLVQFARVESRRSGVPIEVLVAADGRGVEAMRIDVEQLDLDATAGADSFEGLSVDGDRGGSDPGRRFASAWARHDLEDGRLVPPPDGTESDLFDDAFMPTAPGTEDGLESFDAIEDPWPGRTRLAIFFPDGTSVTTAPAVVESTRGARKWTIDRWSGRSTFETVAPEQGDGSPLDPADAGGDSVEIDDFGDLETGRREAAGADPGTGS